MSDFIKDLSDLTPLEADTLFVVADGGAAIINPAYKTSLDDIGSYVIGTIRPPIVLQDLAAFTASVGTITTYGQVTSSATLSSTTDYDNLSVGDTIILSTSYVDSMTVSVKAGSNLINYIGGGLDAVTVSFAYGAGSVISEDSTGNVKSSMSKGGFSTDGSVNATALGAHSVTVRNVLTDIISTSINATLADKVSITTAPTSGNVIQDNFNDSMITTPYSPSYCAKMSADQAVSAGGWTRINFNISNGSDTEKITHDRVPSGQTGYDNTNRCFKVPYTAAYSATSYTISFTVRCYYQVAFPPGVNYLFGKVLGSSSATGGTGWDLLYARHQSTTFGGASANYDIILHNISTIHLDPSANANHRYLSVYVFSQFSSVTIYSGGSGQTLFSGTCNG